MKELENAFNFTNNVSVFRHKISTSKLTDFIILQEIITLSICVVF